MKNIIYVFFLFVIFVSCNDGDRKIISDNRESDVDFFAVDGDDSAKSDENDQMQSDNDSVESEKTDIADEEPDVSDDAGSDEIQNDDDSFQFPCGENQCYIDGKCIDHFKVDSERICQWCNIYKNKYGWSLRSANTVCRESAGICDLEESCTGLSAYCPADTFKDNAVVCREIAGDSDCDVEERCSGLSAECPEDGFQPSTVVCRESAGVCDAEEKCTGTSAFCPTDLKLTTVCRESAGDCDVAESCDGENNNCPSDLFKSSSVVCREADGICDVAENCTGSSPACPDDSVAQNTVVCRGLAGDCDIEEKCDGTSKTCPEDALKPSTETCRVSGGVCDIEEKCTGSSAECPTDAKLTSVCRESAGVCDIAENCDGVNDDCPADSFAGTDVACTDDGNLCNGDEYCDGSGNCSHFDALICNFGEYCVENTGECLEYTYKVLCTDQDKCYDNSSEIICPSQGENYYGQDFQYSEQSLCIPKNFTLSGSGSEVTVIDNNTRLEWMENNPTSYYTWSNAVNYCENLDYNGYDDWRLPTAAELGTIVDFGNYSPTLDKDYFSDITFGYMWSSTVLANNSSWSWIVDYDYGRSGQLGQSYQNHLMCVRGNEWFLPNNFQEKESLSNEIIVKDLSSKLIWTKNYEENMNWQEALDYCENLDYLNHTDWRLPNINELKTLVNLDKVYPASDFPEISKDVFWSSTSYVGNRYKAWTVSFNGGQAFYDSKSIDDGSVLCVASGVVKECESGETGTIPCGYNNNGTQPAVCVDGFWDADGECIDPDECLNDDEHFAVCAENENKIQEQICANGQWNNVGLCIYNTVLCTIQDKCYDDTGEITCPSEGEDYFGQDAQYAAQSYCIPKSFTISGTSPEEIIIDNNTGLQWQKAVVWDKYGWSDAIDYCDTLIYGGYDDWRLPFSEELESILDYGEYRPSIDNFLYSEGFLFAWDYYWSSSSNVLSEAWAVNLANGYVSSGTNTTETYLRCVRGLEREIHTFSSKETLSGDTVVTDDVTGLQWTKGHVSGATWKEALKYCQDLTYAGYSDWRLPNINELKSIVTRDQVEPSSNFPDMISDWVWSSSSLVNSNEKAWGLNFSKGSVNYGLKTSSSNAMCIANGIVRECEPEETGTMSCGYNGNGVLPVTCVDGFWEIDGECADPDECENDETRNIDCGMNNRGTQSQICFNGEWINEGDCIFPLTYCSGQTKCYDNAQEIVAPSKGEEYYGQDAQYALRGYCIPKDFEISGTSSEGIIVDNNTGLQWQQILPEIYDGCTEGSVSGEKCSPSEAKQYCSNLNYGGYSDWRLPAISELESIVNYGNNNSAISTEYFSDIKYNNEICSSTILSGDSRFIFSIYMSSGKVRYSYTGRPYSVTCVRGNYLPSHSFKKTTVNGDVIVTDSLTNFQWTKEIVSSKNWKESLEYCENLNYGNFEDWRLPNINELITLINTKKYDPASDFPNIFSGAFWASTTFDAENVSAWSVGMLRGEISFGEKSNLYSVICMR